jgi:hypothetical protein
MTDTKLSRLKRIPQNSKEQDLKDTDSHNTLPGDDRT